MKRQNNNWLRAIALGIGLAGGTMMWADSVEPARAYPPLGLADRFDDAVFRWDYEEAKAALDALDDSPAKTHRKGVLAFVQARYADAESHFVTALSSDELSDDDASEASSYLLLSRGAQEAIVDETTVLSPDGHFEAVFLDDKDELLAPYFFDAMALAHERLGEATGITPADPLRFEFLDDPAKLSLVTSLSLDAVYTTGTVGITKYGRVMMVSPRVMLMGYGWLDTAVHEYVHVLVTLRTRNQAPVWMQEGLAKLLETRWRRDEPAPLEPSIAALLNRAIERDELVTLEQMYPSVALLPSQELAALAYAETETMLVLVWEKGGDEALRTLMDEVANGIEPKDALANAYGTTFEVFFEDWKREMGKRTAGIVGEEQVRQLTFRQPGDDEDVDPTLLGDVFSHLGGGRARQHARLGVLLTLRGHKKAATIEYEKARAADPKARKDPKLARRLGELHLELGDAEAALPLLELAAENDPDNPNLAAAYGRALLQNGKAERAAEALERAIGQNPFIPTLHCDLAALAEDEERREFERTHCVE